MAWGRRTVLQLHSGRIGPADSILRNMTPNAIRWATATLALLVGACFPTFQSPRIEPGWHGDLGVVAIHDQDRETGEGGMEVLAYVSPAIGVSSSVEFGMALGLLSTDVMHDEPGLVFMPYAKVGILPPDGRDHLAISFQTSALFFPANLGVHYGRDLGSWEPQLSLTRLFGAGPSGDGGSATRYTEQNQSLWALGIGATWRARHRPGVMIGLLSNRYDDCCVRLADGTYGPERVHAVDLFVSGRFGL